MTSHPDYSLHTASWHRRVDEIQDALRLKKYATVLAKLAELQASLVQVDAIVQDLMEQRSPTASKGDGAAAS